MKTTFSIKRLFSKFFCILMVVLFVVSSVLPCFAAAVKVPVFTKMPEKRTLIAGTESYISASARVFNYDSTDIKYSLEVLKGTSFISSKEFYTAKSGAVVKLDVKSGKDSKLLLNHGTYTARIRAATLDSEGMEIAVGYCPAFEITVLPPIIRAVEADKKVCYGGEFSVRALLNEYYQDDGNTAFFWTVSDGTSVHTLTEGETVNGIVITGTETGTLKIFGLPEKIFTLTFSASALREGAEDPQTSNEVSVMFRPSVEVGFSLGEDGMRYFRENGTYVTGWFRRGDSVYYFCKDDGIMMTGEKVIDGKKCLFAPDGKLMLGFFKTPLGYRYAENGTFVKGWHLIDGMYCYFDPFSGYMIEDTANLINMDS